MCYCMMKPLDSFRVNVRKRSTLMCTLYHARPSSFPSEPYPIFLVLGLQSIVLSDTSRRRGAHNILAKRGPSADYNGLLYEYTRFAVNNAFFINRSNSWLLSYMYSSPESCKSSSPILSFLEAD